ncbi:MAG: heptaprenyl diphosphate synthase [Myxococcota bacterium]
MTPSTAQLAVPQPVLDELEAHGLPIAETIAAVEERLRGQVASNHAFMQQAARYLMDAGGKRFRPMMVALSSHLGDTRGPEIAEAGVIVELVHLATLYHDDVIDEATARRGTPSANLRWDNTVSILTGDYLFARASALSADLGVEVTRIMAQTIAQLCEGQIQEVQGSFGALPPDVPRLEATVDHYINVIGGKTASLIASSCRLGALLSGCTPDEVEAATRYGWDVGLAFQMSDDLLDITSDQQDSGKTPGTDLLEGVRTLPILFAIETDADGELTKLVEIGPELQPAQIARALELLRGSDAMTRARDVASEYVATASAELEMFGDRPVVKALTRLAEYAVDRVG